MTQLRSLPAFIGWMALAYAALAQGASDGRDFLIWQRQYGFAQGETLELVYERIAASLQVEITNKDGEVIGTVDLEADSTVQGAGRPTHSSGFGFVTFGAENGVLLIDGTRYGPLSVNPSTGRHVLGFRLVGSKAPSADRRVPSATLTVVGPGGETRAGYKLENVQISSYSLGGG